MIWFSLYLQNYVNDEIFISFGIDFTIQGLLIILLIKGFVNSYDREDYEHYNGPNARGLSVEFIEKSYQPLQCDSTSALKNNTKYRFLQLSRNLTMDQSV